MTGGLGPTKDDITKHTLVEYFQTTLIRNTEVESRLEDWFSKRGRVLKDANRKQADLPQNCEVLPNLMGTASGMWFNHLGKVLISMPGVPYEMKHLMQKQVIPKLLERFQLPAQFHHTIMTAGIVESALAELIADIEDRLPQHIKLAYLPKPGLVRLRLSAYGAHQSLLQQETLQFADEIKFRIGLKAYGTNELTLTEAIGEKLKIKGEKLSLAESCTGGLVSHLVTSIPGSSDWYEGGVVSYSNAMKINLLKVSPNSIEQFGAVSETVVTEMAKGIRMLTGAQWGIALSGVAGPTVGSAEKPVGTVWMAISGHDVAFTECINFGDQRGLIMERAAWHVLFRLWELLNK
jgi:nicotinamide-nucleotide amidase